jgi:tRNA pseudouridine38-40 synthase
VRLARTPLASHGALGLSPFGASLGRGAFGASWDPSRPRGNTFPARGLKGRVRASTAGASPSEGAQHLSPSEARRAESDYHPPVPRFRLTIEYAGTRYSGWQKQKNARTVQGELERAIAEATGTRSFEFQGAGRTDAGVHALAQVAHLDVATRVPPVQLARAINDELPADIHVLDLARAAPRFHARHAAVMRSYVYQISRRRTAFAKPYVWWVRDRLDVERMRTAAAGFEGLKDFRAFSDDDPGEKSTKVLVEDVQVGEAGDLVLIRVAGSHFLWKMVRRMVGVLVEIGRGALPPDAVTMLMTEDSATPARLTAPASGLFLERVFYEGDAWPLPLAPAVPVGG